MSAYDKQKVDDWLHRVAGEFAMVVWLAVTSRQCDGNLMKLTHLGLAGEYQQTSAWEQANCLYGLKDKINQHMGELIKIASAVARREDELT